MSKDLVLEYFEDKAKSGEWDSLYNPGNPMSYSFIVRLKKALDLLEDIEGKTVCDMGCGTGILIPFILERKGFYLGIDNSDSMLEQIKQTYKNDYRENKFSLIKSDFENIDLATGFDTAIGLGFIEYFENPAEVIEKIFNLLPISGQIVLSFPNFLSLDYFSVRIFFPIRYFARKVTGKSTPQPPRKLWTITKAKRMMIASGFRDIRVSNYNINFFFYPFSRFFPRFCNFISNNLEYSPIANLSFFSTGFIITAHK